MKTTSIFRLRLFDAAVLLLWLAAVIFISYYHEVWRDEVRALSLVRAADSITDLATILKNEGHPLLWYVILYLGYTLYESTLILKIASIVIGFAGVVVFWICSPFKSWLKVMFIFSWLPFYEYSVMARNYGISMLLMFGIGAILNNRQDDYQKLSWWLVVLLFLLANTNFHSTLCVSILVTTWWLYLLLTYKEQNGARHLVGRTVLQSIVVVIGITIGIISVLPDKNSIVLQPGSIEIVDVAKEFLNVLCHPGEGLDALLAGIPLWGRDVILILLMVSLIVRPLFFVMAFVGTILFGIFFNLGYAGALRHEGILFIFILLLFWLVNKDLSGGRIQDKNKILKYGFKAGLYSLIPFILAIHLVGSFKYYKRDYFLPMSCSKAFGDYLINNQKFHDAILIGDPDFRLESIPYYVSNPIYNLREKRFQKFVRLTKDNAQNLSLTELLNTAIFLRFNEKREVLIALGHFYLSIDDGGFRRGFEHGKMFTWTPESLIRFREVTEKLTDFVDDVRGERYEIYSLKEQWLQANRDTLMAEFAANK